MEILTEFAVRGINLMRIESRPTGDGLGRYSFFIDCETQEEVDYFWEKLSAGGEKSRCGWLKDQFGVSWQVVPSVLGDMLNAKDQQRSQRVMEAMLQMDKLNIQALQKAYKDG